MTRRTNTNRTDTEAGLILAEAQRLDISAYEAAKLLSFTPTNRAITKAHERMLEADGIVLRPLPADPFIGLPRN